ncbi:hypothetical protein GGI21_003871 [Coemansia aciculifera]|uniref:Uncharacterized protein n=1 Tax=Coemansia aciculifera TaxID=417176 RepID=A0ACC1M5A8_9FUNG|nr:hypothetical protein IWW38_002056 [Coemansia aciculifera]KAJ2907456.1 hypothetical protein GGI21_003871 [Coemansia aciculifera]
MALGIKKTMLVALVVLLSCLCRVANGNTCIRHFSPTTEHQSPGRHTLDQISALLPGGLSVLSAPYTSSPIATISTYQSTNASRADKENWYLLDDTLLGASYELRISNAAATGVDFDIVLYSASDVIQLLNETAIAAVADKKRLFGAAVQIAVYAKVTASYTGHSTWPDVANRPATYIIVLEKHVFGLPVQALKLIAVLAVAIMAGLFVVTPRLVAKLNSVAVEEEKPKHKLN